MVPWRREWLSTPVFLSVESHGQRNLAGYGPWGHKESDTTQQLTLIFPRNIDKSFPKIGVCSFLSHGAAFSKKITDTPGCGGRKPSILVTNFCQVTNKFIFCCCCFSHIQVYHQWNSKERIFVVKNYWQQIETIPMRTLFLWKDYRIAVAAEKRVGSWGDFCLSSKKGVILVYLYANHTCQVGRKKSVI